MTRSGRETIKAGGHAMRLATAPALIVALSALALLAAACGSSSPPPTAAPAPTATATAVAVETPTPTATPTPGATSTAATVTVTDAEGTTGAYDIDRLADRALDFLTAFTNDLSPRASGTDQERTAADFLAKLFEDLGYSTSVQEFSFEVAGASAALSAGDGEANEVPAVRMHLSGLGEATGELVHVDLALAEDVPDEGLDGKIALVGRGNIRFEEKIRRVAEAGAAGAIVYNNEPGLFGGRLETQSRIPVVATSQETGEDILALIEEGDVQATIAVTNKHLPSQNVIAETPGSDGRVVVVGGHYDTVPGVPGANDNGSGIASIVTVAEEIAGSDYPFTVRIIAFGAEELGLYGSAHYVQSLSEAERTSIVAMLNYDALAGSDILGVTGDSELQTTAVELAGQAGIDLRRRLLPRNWGSDHMSFIDAGIPSVFFMDNDFSRIHTPQDKLEFINKDLMGQSAAIGLALLDHLADR